MASTHTVVRRTTPTPVYWAGVPVNKRRYLEPINSCSHCGKVNLARTGVESVVVTNFNQEPAWFCDHTCLCTFKYERGYPGAMTPEIYDRVRKTFYQVRVEARA